jgi:2-keto-4-pentenoate hydratase/2-oxohepta-3-ene-1,7-dioic acid hydratase in catechol pathway
VSGFPSKNKYLYFNYLPFDCQLAFIDNVNKFRRSKMRICRFANNNNSGYGVIKDNLIHVLKGDPFAGFPGSPVPTLDGNTCELDKVKLLSPCLPSKIVCLGVNYRPHAQEMHSSLPSNPLIFLKPATAVIGPDDPIILPRNWKRVDYEGELGVVIAQKAKNVSEEEAKKYVLGYTCFNDVTERQYQKDDGQWTRAKGFDTFAPIGPWIETELAPDDLKLETYLNGELRQSSRTSEMVFGISKLISFISGVMTLLPGDIIATGTPSGIGQMISGDIVEVKIEKIGTLRNYVLDPQ